MDLSDMVSDKSVHGLKGVEIDRIIKDQRQEITKYEPSHPDADEDGMLKLPNISPIEEMLDIITAARAYEANLKALKQSKAMAEKTIQMGRQN